MKDLMAAVSGLFGKRYSARQKERFARYMENRARERGIKWAEDTQRLGFGVCRNLYLGDLKRAKLLLAIPYDTAARIWWAISLLFAIVFPPLYDSHRPFCRMTC